MLSRKIPLLQADGEGEENHLSVLYAIATGLLKLCVYFEPKNQCPYVLITLTMIMLYVIRPGLIVQDVLFMSVPRML